MNKKLHILVWITLASLVSACQMHPKNGQPGFDPVDLHELRVVTSGGFAEAYKAESIGYSASASGTYLSTVLLPGLGLWEQLESKSKRILSERVATVVARGEVEIGFQQISEILPIEGVAYAGPIPSKYQKVTTFSMGITTRAKNLSDARRLVDFLSSAEVAAIIAATGLEPVIAWKRLSF